MRADYALIVGGGRSGTNWLLELFDQSPETFCRNEPYGAPESPLNELADDRFWVRHDQSALDSRWDEVIAWTSTHMGERDHAIKVPKSYMFEISRTLGLYRMVQGPRLRRLTRRVIPALRGGEWPVPRWIAHPGRLAEATAILKLVAPPGWAVFVLQQRPQIPVFHIIRHPGGFLNSWANRWAAGRDMNEIKRKNEERLRRIGEVDPAWAERFGDITPMSADRSELWYWHYVNEVIYEAGKGRQQYHRIIYEDLVSDPARTMRRCYEAAGLSWDPVIEARISVAASDSAAIASAWRKKLASEHIELVEEFLSPIPEFYAERTAMR